MEAITGKYLQELTQRGKAAGVELQLPAELAQVLGSGAGTKAGARQLRKRVQEQVEAPLSAFLLQSDKKLSMVRGELQDGVLHFMG